MKSLFQLFELLILTHIFIHSIYYSFYKIKLKTRNLLRVRPYFMGTIGEAVNLVELNEAEVS